MSHVVLNESRFYQLALRIDQESARLLPDEVLPYRPRRQWQFFAQHSGIDLK